MHVSPAAIARLTRADAKLCAQDAALPLTVVRLDMDALITNPCTYIVLVQIAAIYINTKQHSQAQQERKDFYEEQRQLLYSIRLQNDYSETT